MVDGVGAVEVDDGAEAVRVSPETVLFVAVAAGGMPELKLEESDDNAMRDFSARGRYV